MSARSSDVTLVVRARDEAQKTLDAITGTMEKLFGAQEKVAGSADKTGSNITNLASVLATLDKAYATVAGNADKAGSAFERQKQAIAGQKDDLRNLQTQANNAAAALANLNSADAIVSAGRDQSGRLAAIKAVSAEYARLEAQQNKLAGTIAKQESALGSSASSLQRIGTTANAVEAAVAKARIELDSQTKAMDRSTAAAERNAATMGRVNRVTAVERGPAVANGATFSALDAQQQAIATAAARLRDELNPVAAIEARLSTEQAKLNRLFAAGAIEAHELSGGMAVLRGNADKAIAAVSGNGRAKPSLFGLRSHDLQNLGFQVNDVVTQLASGTSLTQTLGQQGGQIIQLFPRVGAAVVAGLTSAPVIGFTAALGALILGLKEASDQAETLRKLDSVLTLNADGARYLATSLAESGKALDKFGLSADDALAIVKAGVANGLDPSRITEFGMAAKDMADVLGIKATDAANQLAEALSGNFDALEKLDKATNVFSAAQLELIKNLFEQGRAQDAVAAASDIMYGKLDEAAAKARGPWTEAIKSMGAAWSEFLTYLGQTGVIHGASDVLDRMANSAAKFFREMRGARTLGDIKNDLKDINDLISADRKKGGNSTYLANLKAQYEAELAIAKKAADSGPDQTALRLSATETQRKANARVADEIERAQISAGKVTKESDIQAKLAQVRAQALRDIQKREPGASPQQQAAFADSAVADKRVALEKQLADYKKQQADSAKTAAAAEERATKAFVQRVIKAESGGNNNAKNPNSTATGAGQFIESTWLSLFRKYYPETAQNMGREAILALRKDGDTAKSMIELYARENAAALKKSGNAVTEANLQLAHFLGAAGANKVLKAAPGTSIANLFSDARGRQAIAANPTILGAGKTVDTVKAYAAKRAGVDVGATDQAQLEGAARLDELAQNRLDTQAMFNEGIADEVEQRKLAIAALQAQTGLDGETLIKEQRKQTAAQAVLAKQQEVDKLNADRATNGLAPVEFTDAQRKAIEDTTAAYYDLAHAKDVAAARRDAVDDPVRDLTAQRDAIQAQIQFNRETGRPGAASQIEPQLDTVNAKLKAATDAQLRFYESILAGGPAVLAQYGYTAEAVQAVIDRINATANTATDFGHIMGVSGQEIADTFASGAASGFDHFAQSLAKGKGAFDSMKSAFLSFSSSFLSQIAQMIVQQQALNAVAAIGKIFGASTGAIGAGDGGALDAGQIFHSGGIVGAPGNNVFVRPEWFANVNRYHSGGIAGLKPDEVPAILRKGEEVLTASDSRHRANGGGGGNGAQIKVVNTFDRESAITEMMNTTAGEKAVLNMIKNNSAAVKAAIG